MYIGYENSQTGLKNKTQIFFLKDTLKRYKEVESISKEKMDKYANTDEKIPKAATLTHNTTD